MLELTVRDAAIGAGAQAEPAWPGADLDAFWDAPFRAVRIDSRQVEPGDLFIALSGAHTSGALFAGEAIARGALAVLTDRACHIDDEQLRARRLLPMAPLAAAVLRVADPLAALQRAAAHWRSAHPQVRVVGVTGSVGKTTTREAIAGVLGRSLPVLASSRSFNNEIGLPLTLLGLERAHRAAVLEMGMYAAGEIAALAALARPAIGVVTMVAPVHLARLGSLAAIAAAKAELVAALPDARVRAMAALTPARSVFFGLHEGNEWRAVDLVDGGMAGFAFTLCHGARRARVTTPLVGRHFVHALLAAAAVAEAYGIAWDEIADALPAVRIGERQRVVEAPHDRLVIDDSWNASEPSMLAALDVLASVPRRHIAVLGEMLELGEHAERAHRSVGRRAGQVVDGLVTVGAGGAIIAEEVRRAGRPGAVISVVERPEDVTSALESLLRDGDAVLVKGSRGLRLERTIDWLLEQ